MAAIDTRLEAMTRRAIYRAAGDAQVTFQRVTGAAPNVTILTATICALVRNYLPDSTAASQQGYSSGQVGGLTVGERSFLVMADDLANAGFPLPLQKGDNLLHADTGEKLTITRIDPHKRGIAGAIEGFAEVA